METLLCVSLTLIVLTIIFLFFDYVDRGVD